MGKCSYCGPLKSVAHRTATCSSDEAKADRKQVRAIRKELGCSAAAAKYIAANRRKEAM
jgi:hypothetical protein